MSLYSQIMQFAKEDADEFVSIANRQAGLNMSVMEVSLDKTIRELLDPELDDASVTATATISDQSNEFDFSWEYLISGDSIYVNEPAQELAQDLLMRRTENSSVLTSTAVTKDAILAADDDFFSDDDTDDSDGVIAEDPDDTVGDSIDDLADAVGDIQDDLDDAEEDDTDIEIDNNIDSHYIAECENCHGIFISAVIESDQDVEKVSGKCPLCDKEADQYLKWVIKSVNKQ